MGRDEKMVSVWKEVTVGAGYYTETFEYVPPERVWKSSWVTYDEYLASGHWWQFRKKALREANYRCAECGWFSPGGVKNRAKGFNVHHLHYESLGRESLDDVRVLCRDCHVSLHEGQRHERARDTYMTKKYGEDWDSWADGEEFDEWLESKQEYA